MQGGARKGRRWKKRGPLPTGHVTTTTRTTTTTTTTTTQQQQEQQQQEQQQQRQQQQQEEEQYNKNNTQQQHRLAVWAPIFCFVSRVSEATLDTFLVGFSD